MPCSSASSGGMCSKHLGLQASAPPTPRGILLLCEDQADIESPESSCRFGQQAIVASSLSLSEDYKRQTHSMRVAWSSPGSTKNGTLGEGCGIVPARQGLTSVLPVHRPFLSYQRMYYVFISMLSSGPAWLGIILLVTVGLLPDVLKKVLCRQLWPTATERTQVRSLPGQASTFPCQS